MENDKITITNNIDLSTDTAFKIIRFVDGKETKMGYTKYRNKSFQLIAGNAEPGDLLKEYNYSSFHYLFTAGETTYQKHTYIAPAIGIAGNIGKMTESDTFSETWFEISLSKGYLPELIAKKQTITYTRLGIYFEKKFYIKGIYIAPGIGFNLEGTRESIPEKNMTEEEKSKYRPTSISLRPGITFGKSFSPNLNVFIRVGEPATLSKNNSFIPYGEIGFSVGY